MAKVIVKQGFLSVGGKLYRKGEVVEVGNAEDIARRSGGRIALAGADVKPARQEKPGKQEKPERKPDVSGEEIGALPDADPAAAVKK